MTWSSPLIVDACLLTLGASYIVDPWIPHSSPAHVRTKRNMQSGGNWRLEDEIRGEILLSHIQPPYFPISTLARLDVGRPLACALLFSDWSGGWLNPVSLLDSCHPFPLADIELLSNSIEVDQKCQFEYTYDSCTTSRPFVCSIRSNKSGSTYYRDCRHPGAAMRACTKG